MIEVGTRGRTTQLSAAADQGRQTRGFSRDVNLSKQADGSFTFSAAAVIGPAGCFAAFQPGDVVLTEGTNANNGYKTILTITNGNTITGAKGFVAEGPVAATIRTA